MSRITCGDSGPRLSAGQSPAAPKHAVRLPLFPVRKSFGEPQLAVMQTKKHARDHTLRPKGLVPRRDIFQQVRTTKPARSKPRPRLQSHPETKSHISAHAHFGLCQISDCAQFLMVWGRPPRPYSRAQRGASAQNSANRRPAQIPLAPKGQRGKARARQCRAAKRGKNQVRFSGWHELNNSRSRLDHLTASLEKASCFSNWQERRKLYTTENAPPGVTRNIIPLLWLRPVRPCRKSSRPCLAPALPEASSRPGGFHKSSHPCPTRAAAPGRLIRLTREAIDRGHHAARGQPENRACAAAVIVRGVKVAIQSKSQKAVGHRLCHYRIYLRRSGGC
jgi:hypothetical protein